MKIGFSNSTTWTCPLGVTQIQVELWGAGGGAGSTSGYKLNSLGSSCYVSADQTPYSPSVSGLGASGGSGGKGGYIKTIIAVLPGTIYSVVIGNGGSGGRGGMSVNVNSGTNGNDGEPTMFLNGTTILAQADYGRGGMKGMVACCPYPNLGTTAVSCNGWQNGVDGVNGAVFNHLTTSSIPDPRSYIPNGYLPTFTDCCAQGGLKPNVQSSGLYNHNGFGSIYQGSCNLLGSCIIYSSNGTNGNVEVSPAPGNNGESGFCIISY